MAAEPTEAEVLAWMTRTGGTAADAVQHFWGLRPGDPDYKRCRDRVNQQASRARRSGRSDAPPAADPGPISTASQTAAKDAAVARRPPPDLETARLDRLPFLEWQLSELLADLAWARAAGRLDYASKVDARVSDVRQQLDMARAEGGKVVSLERSPAAVADEVERRAKRIRELAERARAADGREREL